MDRKPLASWWVQVCRTLDASLARFQLESLERSPIRTLKTRRPEQVYFNPALCPMVERMVVIGLGDFSADDDRWPRGKRRSRGAETAAGSGTTKLAITIKGLKGQGFNITKDKSARMKRLAEWL